MQSFEHGVPCASEPAVSLRSVTVFINFCRNTFMKIHEYQAKDILAKYGVAVPRGEVANTLDEAVDVASGSSPTARTASWSRRRSMPAAAARAAA